MRNFGAALSALFICLGALSAFGEQAKPALDDPFPIIHTAWRGVWEGGIEFSEGLAPFTIRVSERVILLDMPAQNMFGYPVTVALCDATRLRFAMAAGATPIVFDCSLGKTSTGSNRRAEGMFSRGDAGSHLYLLFSQLQPDPSTRMSFDTGRGLLPGTLTVPAGSPEKAPALVILLAGAGTMDRDGNNYVVPGRNDALRQLAEKLSKAGVASFRYDKRGAGEAAYLVPDESRLVFADFVADARACVTHFKKDKRFSRVLVFGYAEGALVGAAAIGAGAKADAFVAACASARSVREIVVAETEKIPEEYRAEITRVIAELDAGRYVDVVSDYISQLFRRSFQPYMASWLSYEPVREFSRVKCPTLLLQGQLDMQVDMIDFKRLSDALPDAETAVVEGMNHVLKIVTTSVDENYAAFGDPSFEIAPALVSVVAAFARR